MTWTWLGIATLAVLVLACYIGYRHGFIREVVSAFLVIISMMIVSAANPYVNEFIRENTPVYDKVQEGCKNLVESELGTGGTTGERQQEEMIGKLELPDFLRNGLLENNTSEVYQYLSVDSFTEYISGYLARIIVNAISFLISFFLATILIRTITFALNLLASLPVINGVNRIAGGVVGGLKCILFIWVAFLLITALCETEIGRQGLELIKKDTVLSFLYDQNILARVFTNIFYGK